MSIEQSIALRDEAFKRVQEKREKANENKQGGKAANEELKEALPIID